MHGRFDAKIEKSADGNLIVNGKTVKLFNKMDPKDIPWGAVDASFICESTGAFLSKDKAQSHLLSGAKRVIMSAPAKDDTPTFVYGVNHHQYKPEQLIVSNASCTTNCLAPIAKVLNDKFGIEEGLMTTVHAMT